jgi:ABC-type phosphate/phosphonate transport system substrate-binding protein
MIGSAGEPIIYCIANARMYSVVPAAAAAWRDLFDWLARDSGVVLDVIDHPFPLPLSDLWSRKDLACAFMCGFPFMLSGQRPRPVAAPIPAAAPLEGRPVYATRLVVRSESSFQRLEDTFGARLGYTMPDSHSGYNALRHHLLPYFRERKAKLYGESVGPLTTPRRVIDALSAGTIDIGPLDSYALDLMLRHDENLPSQIRVIATTDPAPIPLLVAAAGCPDQVVAKLQSALARFADAPECVSLKDRLCLAGFVQVATRDYEQMLLWDSEARLAGYTEPG